MSLSFIQRLHWLKINFLFLDNLYYCDRMPVDFDVFIRLLSALPNHPTLGDYLIPI
jgi:hypothetical protein